jgi:hypothetical protein
MYSKAPKIIIGLNGKEIDLQYNRLTIIEDVKRQIARQINFPYWPLPAKAGF